MHASNIVVALDGPSGVGKSTIARRLALRLELPYLDTGAMYRGFAFKVLEGSIDPEDQLAVEELAALIIVDVLPTENGDFQVVVDGQAVSESIRSPEVSQATSKIAAYPKVRAAMVSKQRSAALSRGAVVEGRDIGSAVFPQANFKFYLEAPIGVRSRRRYEQLLETGGPDLTLAQVEKEVIERDFRDSNRVESPLKIDSSYRVISTADSTVDEIVEQMAMLIRNQSNGESLVTCALPPE